ncbi:MFS multidrug transporter [Auriculariales sp. MPI-PUGE-AT-0066]|nr:MFS multidrug transporter [Auriculariales sp. MPI-PUGE-AT-0066]
MSMSSYHGESKHSALGSQDGLEAVVQLPTAQKPVSLEAQPPKEAPKKGLRFWLIMFSLMISLYEAAFEMCAVGIALPTISEELNATDFVWVGSAYALAASCALPMTGGLADVMGRKGVMLISLVIFAAGAAVCGAAQSMTMLIIGRTIQGIGGGGILSLPAIILSDLVSLRERGAYNGLLGVTWSVAIVTSAIVAGALANHGQWRWIFYLNIPVTAVAILLVVVALKTPTPKGSLGSKLKKIDWIGNFIIIASTCLCCVALTWAGIKYDWVSLQVLVPLGIGAAGFILFFFYEVKVATNPLIPFRLLGNRTTVMGYISTFVNSLIAIMTIYYLPVYTQACWGDSAQRSGSIDWLGLSCTVGPFGIVAGVSVAVIKKYRPTILFGWALAVTSMVLYMQLKVETKLSTLIGYEVVFGLGVGALYTTTYFPVLAPLPVSANARALAFFNFCRCFAQVWGVTIGASVLQNQLLKKLPQEFVSKLPAGVQVAYTAIPHIAELPDALRQEVRVAFQESLRTVWITTLIIAGVGALSLLGMKEVKMHAYTDSDWGIEEEPSQKPMEMTSRV